MENFRLFLIRVFQVVWICIIGFSLFAMLIEFSIETGFTVLMLLGVPSLILQFLIFANLNPLDMYNGKIKENTLK